MNFNLFQGSSETALNDLGEDIVYAQAPPSAGGNEQYVKSEQQQTSIQYVTPQQYEKGTHGIRKCFECRQIYVLCDNIKLCL